MENKQQENNLTCKATVVDWCYGMTGGIKISCPRHGYIVLSSMTSDYMVEQKCKQHNETGTWGK